MSNTLHCVNFRVPHLSNLLFWSIFRSVNQNFDQFWDWKRIDLSHWINFQKCTTSQIVGNTCESKWHWFGNTATTEPIFWKSVRKIVKWGVFHKQSKNSISFEQHWLLNKWARTCRLFFMIIVSNMWDFTFYNDVSLELKKELLFLLKKNIHSVSTQCMNSRIFLTFRIYVKSS